MFISSWCNGACKHAIAGFQASAFNSFAVSVPALMPGWVLIAIHFSRYLCACVCVCVTHIGQSTRLKSRIFSICSFVLILLLLSIPTRLPIPHQPHETNNNPLHISTFLVYHTSHDLLKTTRFYYAIIYLFIYLFIFFIYLSIYFSCYFYIVGDKIKNFSIRLLFFYPFFF